MFVQLLLFAGCKNGGTEVSKECEISIDTIDFTFGIDYSDPGKYLVPGEESDLSDTYLEEIRSATGTPGDSVADILRVCHWVNKYFTFQDAGGEVVLQINLDSQGVRLDRVEGYLVEAVQLDVVG